MLNPPHSRKSSREKLHAHLHRSVSGGSSCAGSYHHTASANRGNASSRLRGILRFSGLGCRIRWHQWNQVAVVVFLYRDSSSNCSEAVLESQTTLIILTVLFQCRSQRPENQMSTGQQDIGADMRILKNHLGALAMRTKSETVLVAVFVCSSCCGDGSARTLFRDVDRQLVLDLGVQLPMAMAAETLPSCRA